MATLTAIPSSYDSVNNVSQQSTTYPFTNAYSNSSSTSYASLKITSGTSNGYVAYGGFDFSGIPSNATINSVTIKIKSSVSNTSRMTTATAQARKGTTLVGGALDFKNTSASARTITAGTWSRADLDNLNVYITIKRSSTMYTPYAYIYGMDVTVDYTVPEDKLLVKDSGSYKQVTKAYKKINGSWIEQDKKNLFNTTSKYIKL